MGRPTKPTALPLFLEQIIINEQEEEVETLPIFPISDHIEDQDNEVPFINSILSILSDIEPNTEPTTKNVDAVTNVVDSEDLIDIILEPITLEGSEFDSNVQENKLFTTGIVHEEKTSKSINIKENEGNRDHQELSKDIPLVIKTDEILSNSTEKKAFITQEIFEGSTSKPLD